MGKREGYSEDALWVNLCDLRDFDLVNLRWLIPWLGDSVHHYIILGDKL